MDQEVKQTLDPPRDPLHHRTLLIMTDLHL